MRHIKAIFQETLLGPQSFDNFAEDFADDYDAIPDITRELEYYSFNPFNRSQKLTIDLLIDFVNFDEENVARVSKVVENEKGEQEHVSVKIVRKASNFYVYENEEFLVEFSDEVKLIQRNFSIYKGLTPPDKETFDPPEFAVTILGSSHGFDCHGSTSGFIIWINGKGVMVDPPPYSSRALRYQNIPPNYIEKVIITHCHADHDSGAFHKILESTPV